MTIRTTIIAVNSVAALVVTALISFLLIKEVDQMKRLEAAGEAARIVSSIAKANIEMSFERSLTQVSLKLDTPISPEIQGMLNEQRRKSDQLFRDARAALAQAAAMPERATYLAALDGHLARMASLRQQADPQIRMAMGGRDKATVEKLPTEIKATISAIDRLAWDLRKHLRSAPPEVVATDLVVQRAWAVREYGGRERTIFAIATARREPISQQDLLYAAEAHGRVLQAWGLIEPAQSSAILADDVKRAIGQLGAKYFAEYN